MKRLRFVVFWLHLAAGVTAGLVILVMSITGALLALKPQILNAIEKDVRFVTAPASATRMGVRAIVASVERERPGAKPATVALQSDRRASAAVSLGRDGTVRGIHAGFAGRASGEFYTQTKREVTDLLEKLLAENNTVASR